MIVLLIALGGAAGSVSRYLLGGLIQRTAAVAYPVGTLAVNVIGCALVGFVARMFMNTQTHQQARALVIIGFCGGFTTFSTFSLETLGLMEGGEWGKAIGYSLLTLIACLLGTAAAFALSKSNV